MTMLDEASTQEASIARHRAHCSCGGSSDCYLLMIAQAIEAHLRRSQRKEFEALIARSSVGAAIADIKDRGLDAHLADLEREMAPRRRQAKTASPSRRKRNP
jgi:hypothetical protein